LFTHLITRPKNQVVSKYKSYKIQDTRYKIQDTRYKIQDTRYKIQDTRYKIQDTQVWSFNIKIGKSGNKILYLNHRLLFSSR